MKQQLLMGIIMVSFLGIAATGIGNAYEAPAYVPTQPKPIEVTMPKEIVHQENRDTRYDYYVESIYYDIDIDIPRADQANKLQNALLAIKAHPEGTVKLVGNADSTYNVEYNYSLSQRRIDSVVKYFANNNIDPNRFETIANGDQVPKESNATAEGRAENRRVDIFINY